MLRMCIKSNVYIYMYCYIKSEDISVIINYLALATSYFIKKSFGINKKI